MLTSHKRDANPLPIVPYFQRFLDTIRILILKFVNFESIPGCVGLLISAIAYNVYLYARIFETSEIFECLIMA